MYNDYCRICCRVFLLLSATGPRCISQHVEIRTIAIHDVQERKAPTFFIRNTPHTDSVAIYITTHIGNNNTRDGGHYIIYIHTLSVRYTCIIL